MYHIKPYLKDKGYNLTKLAEKLNMSFQKFDHHIKPKDDLSYNFVKELSSVLDLEMENFIENVTQQVNEAKSEETTSN
tara:strand:+ start:137 stop:370 length:234 start_codon:yes stop_codon:yes gene_type:complete